MKLKTKITALCSALMLLSMSTSPCQARESYTLTDNWRLFASSEGQGDRARNISLPYSWTLEHNMPVNMTSTNFLRTVYLPERYRDSRVFLKFNGVNSIANLYINGSYVGEHRGGATAFVFEITDKVKMGETNMVLLRVSSVPRNDIMPTSVEHEVYGGVYRDVELIVTPKVAIDPDVYGADGVFVTTRSAVNNVAKGDVKIHFTSKESVDRRLTLTMTDSRGKEVFKVVQPKAHISEKTPIVIPFEVANASLWSPENPALYNVKVSLSAAGGVNIENQRDEVEFKCGLRTVSIAQDGRAKGVVKINGKPTYMRGVSLYHDAPATGGVMRDKEHREQIETVLDLGANAIRSAVQPHGSDLYSLCDKLGVMAWVELPFSRSPYLSDVAYLPTEEFEQNGLDQLREMIHQNYNHPSVVMWGLFSLLAERDSRVLDYVKELNEQSKSIDPLRPTVALSNQNGDINAISDLIVWQQNIGWDNGLLGDLSIWSKQLHSKWGDMRSAVMYGAEGAVGHQVDRRDIPASREQRRIGWFPEARQNEMHEEYSKQLVNDELFWGIWHNTLYDFKAPRSVLGESVDGLISFDRETKKDAYYLYRALWNKKKPTLHIADKRARMVGSGSSKVTLRVYASGDDAPVATVNGKKFTMTKVAPAQFVLEGVEVMDRTKITVTQGSLRDNVELIYDSPLRNQER